MIVSCSVIEIANLRDYPELVSTVATWHHNEWLHSYRVSGKESLLIHRDIAEDIREREHNLRTHFSEAAVPSTFIALAVDENTGGKTVIGSVSVVYYQFSKQRKPNEWITNLFVVEAYRNKGIGQQLLEFIHQFAAESGIAHLKLYTRDKEEFYRKRDWQFSHKGLVQGNSVSVLEKRVI
ncbi:GNAT family N-acetyltransferase [Teredinibacter haidensis]|uniref:GNAT family N-acetyltransferase n=1 Tax=Teredinibacter haidensis TaxID=2731755 RepID=UPI000948C38C|nr:GNAT family N-acetyltransferase [Teredinibacter haidensis]